MLPSAVFLIRFHLVKLLTWIRAQGAREDSTDGKATGTHSSALFVFEVFSSSLNCEVHSVFHSFSFLTAWTYIIACTLILASTATFCPPKPCAIMWAKKPFSYIHNLRFFCARTIRHSREIDCMGDFSATKLRRLKHHSFGWCSCSHWLKSAYFPESAYLKNSNFARRIS